MPCCFAPGAGRLAMVACPHPAGFGLVWAGLSVGVVGVWSAMGAQPLLALVFGLAWDGLPGLSSAAGAVAALSGVKCGMAPVSPFCCM